MGLFKNKRSSQRTAALKAMADMAADQHMLGLGQVGMHVPRTEPVLRPGESASTPSQHIYLKPDRKPGFALALVVEPSLHGTNEAAHLEAIEAMAANIDAVTSASIAESIKDEGCIPMIIQFDSKKAAGQISVREFPAIEGSWR